MPLVALDETAGVPARRGETIVVIPLHGKHELFVECLQAALVHTPTSVAIVVVDGGHRDERSAAFLRELDASQTLSHSVYYRSSPQSRGGARSVNDALDMCAPADVIVLHSDCVVTPDWFEGMTRAAADSLVATVSAMTSGGTINPSRQHDLLPLPQTLGRDEAARAIRDQSLRLHPQMPAAVGHCVLIKRSAFELVGPLDDTFGAALHAAEVDFSQRCLCRGLMHVLADDVFVFRRVATPPREDRTPAGDEPERIIDVRYDYYRPWATSSADSKASPWVRSFGIAQRALRSLTVSIDARCLGPVLTGTQLHTLELIAALSRATDFELRAVVPPDMGGYARDVLAPLPVELVDEGSATRRQTDIVHRPWQIGSHADLEFLPQLGERIILTQQDLIGYMNPAYFATYADWDNHRRLTRHALAFADRVVFFSHSAAAEAEREQLVRRDVADVIHIGTDHAIDSLTVEPVRPAGMDHLNGRPYLLCLGTDYLHKNRLFALEVLRQLLEEYEPELALVFAGPHVAVGSSAADEAGFMARHPSLSARVVDLAAVDEGAKRWLLANAVAMIYPSVHEGFGLVPFEAADAGLACAFASHTSLAELLPASLALIEPWDARATARRLAEVLRDPDARARQVEGVREVGARHTWENTALKLRGVYREAVNSPVSECRQLVVELVHREIVDDQLRSVRHELSDLRDAHAEALTAHRELQAAYGRLQEGYWQLDRDFSPDARGLVGPTGVIPPDAQRPLLALASRRRLTAPVWGLLRAGYRAGRAAGRRGDARRR